MNLEPAWLRALLALAIVLGCAWLNRVRGAKKDYIPFLPGRALLWVSVALGLLAWSLHEWPVAVAFGLGYLFWGLWSWGHTLAALGNYKPDRSPSTLEAFLIIFGPPVVQVFVRMMFVLPCVAAVAWLKGNWWFLLAAPAFAAAATLIYALLFRPLALKTGPALRSARGRAGAC